MMPVRQPACIDQHPCSSAHCPAAPSALRHAERRGPWARARAAGGTKEIQNQIERTAHGEHGDQRENRGAARDAAHPAGPGNVRADKRTHLYGAEKMPGAGTGWL